MNYYKLLSKKHLDVYCAGGDAGDGGGNHQAPAQGPPAMAAALTTNVFSPSEQRMLDRSVFIFPK